MRGEARRSCSRANSPRCPRTNSSREQTGKKSCLATIIYSKLQHFNISHLKATIYTYNTLFLEQDIVVMFCVDNDYQNQLFW